MATAKLSGFLHQLTRTTAAEALADQADSELVNKAQAGRDEATPSTPNPHDNP